MTSVPEAYASQIAAMKPYQRVERSLAMAQWAREMIARQIKSEQSDLSDEQLKWLVALRIYGSDPIVREIIERKLADVSG